MIASTETFKSYICTMMTYFRQPPFAKATKKTYQVQTNISMQTMKIQSEHQINIQGEARKEVEGGICKSVITPSKSGSGS